MCWCLAVSGGSKPAHGHKWARTAIDWARSGREIGSQSRGGSYPSRWSFRFTFSSSSTGGTVSWFTFDGVSSQSSSLTSLNSSLGALDRVTAVTASGFAIEWALAGVPYEISSPTSNTRPTLWPWCCLPPPGHHPVATKVKVRRRGCPTIIQVTRNAGGDDRDL